MSVITFVNNKNEETGKTMSLVAIATHMAIEYNTKILIISTTNREGKLKSCYFEDEKARKTRFGLFTNSDIGMTSESGIEGIVRMTRSNKLTPEMVTNYTKVVFKDRLEVLLGTNTQNVIDKKELQQEYLELISVANMYYDRVFVDLDNNIDEEIREQIMDRSDLVIVNSSQNYNSLKELKENKEKNNLLKSAKYLVLIGRYDKYSKYNSKNITRFLEEKNQVLTVPYNTLFFEATNEAKVPDFFLSLKRTIDADDRNAIFIQEVKRASDNIVYRLQEFQIRM